MINKDINISKIFLIFLLLLYYPISVLPQNVLINEIMASNKTTIQDEDGDTPDWIELINADTIAINLSDWKLSDNPSKPDKWIFPETTLESESFLLIFASGKI